MAYRVVKVNTRSREVQVRHEKKYTTSPSSLPILIFPNFAPGNIFGARSFGQINAVECNLLVREVITGYAEKRGRSTIAVPYPPDAKATGVFFDQPRFSRNYFTTGIILTHPAFNRDRAEIERLGSLLFEAFLMIVAFERRDVSFAVDKHRTELEQLGLERDARFIAIYDQAYGSLRLTNRLLQGNTLRLTIAKAIELGAINPMSNAYKKTVETLELLLTETGQSPLDHVLKIQEEGQAGADLVKILLPGSKGLALSNSNKEFQVQEVFWDAKSQRLSYRGRYVDQEYLNATTSIILPVEGLAGVPGESTLGYYDPERKAIRKS
jgi:DEAD/DEAH box helicase domain-containing protein